jgi:hypothetical protein
MIVLYVPKGSILTNNPTSTVTISLYINYVSSIILVVYFSKQIKVHDCSDSFAYIPNLTRDSKQGTQ